MTRVNLKKYISTIHAHIVQHAYSHNGIHQYVKWHCNSIKITKATREAKIILKKRLQNASIDSFKCTKKMKDSNLIENPNKLIVICNIYVFTNF